MTLLGMAGGLQVLFIILFPFIILLLDLIALIDILKNEFTNSNKIIWVLVVIFLPIMGMILYFAIGTNQKVVR